MDTYEYLKTPRINLNGPVGDDMIRDLDRQIKGLDQPDGSKLIVTLKSDGGGIGSAKAIHGELQQLQCIYDSTLVARGMCYSSGVTVAMAFPPERRLALPNTTFLIHQSRLRDSPDLEGDEDARTKKHAVYMVNRAYEKTESNWVMREIAKGCGQSIASVRERAKYGTWFTGQQAINFGLIHAIVAPRIAKSKA